MHEYREQFDEVESILGVLETPLLTHGPREERVFRGSVRDLNCYTAWCAQDVIKTHPEISAACLSEGEDPPPFVSEHEENSDEWITDLFAAIRSEEASNNNDLLFGSYNHLLVDGFESNYAYVEIDLSSPDELLLADFKTWLAGIRKDKRFDHSPVSRFSEKELARWASNRVLPFIDLMLLARALGVQLTNFVAGDKLFPGRDFDPAEKVRKTVAPMAEELLRYEMVEALNRAANADRVSRKELSTQIIPE